MGLEELLIFSAALCVMLRFLSVFAGAGAFVFFLNRSERSLALRASLQPNFSAASRSCWSGLRLRRFLKKRNQKSSVLHR